MNCEKRTRRQSPQEHCKAACSGIYLSLYFQQVWAAPEARTVIPLGKAVGIKLFADGALVVGLSEDGPCPARDCGLKEGDLILTMGDAKITSTEQVRQVLQDNGCEPLALTIRRGSRDLPRHCCSHHRVPMARGSWGRGYATAWPVSAR